MYMISASNNSDQNRDFNVPTRELIKVRRERNKRATRTIRTTRTIRPKRSKRRTRKFLFVPMVEPGVKKKMISSIHEAKTTKTSNQFQTYSSDSHK